MNVRKGKIRRGLQQIADAASDGERVNAVKLTNVSALEILAIRPFLTKALNEFYRLSMGEFTLQLHRPIAAAPPSCPTASSPRRPTFTEPSKQSSGVRRVGGRFGQRTGGGSAAASNGGGGAADGAGVGGGPISTRKLRRFR